MVHIKRINEWVTTRTDDMVTYDDEGVKFYVYELHGRPTANGTKELEFFVFDHETDNTVIRRYGKLAGTFDNIGDVVEFCEKWGCEFGEYSCDVCFSDVFDDVLADEFGADRYGNPLYNYRFIDNQKDMINFIL